MRPTFWLLFLIYHCVLVSVSGVDVWETRGNFQAYEQAKFDEALGNFVRACKLRLANRASDAMGIDHVPDSPTYIRILRNDLPILETSGFQSEPIRVVGLAKEGEYFPVLGDADLFQPLMGFGSSGLSQSGKWAKIRTRSGKVGWVLIEPSSLKLLAELMHQPRPVNNVQSNAPESQIANLGSFLCLAMVGLLIYGIVKLVSSSGHTSSESYSTVSEASDTTDDATSDDTSTDDEKTSDDREQTPAESEWGWLTFSVRVVDQEGNGIEDAVIYAHYHWLRADDRERTDEDGWAHFKTNFTGLVSRGLHTTITVDGEVQADQILVEDGDSFSYTIDRD